MARVREVLLLRVLVIAIICITSWNPFPLLDNTRRSARLGRTPSELESKLPGITSIGPAARTSKNYDHPWQPFSANCWYSWPRYPSPALPTCAATLIVVVIARSFFFIDLVAYLDRATTGRDTMSHPALQIRNMRTLSRNLPC